MIHFSKLIDRLSTIQFLEGVLPRDVGLTIVSCLREAYCIQSCHLNLDTTTFLVSISLNISLHLICMTEIYDRTSL